MREHFGQPSFHEAAQDAQDAIGSSMWELADMVQVDPTASHTFRAVYPSNTEPHESWSAKYIPQQFGSIFPQLDITVSQQSSYEADAPERRFFATNYYDLIMDMGLADHVREVQVGVTTVYRYLQAAEGVVRGVSYKQYIALDHTKYWVPGGNIQGFRMIPEHIEDRAKLVTMQLDMAKLDETDVARVAAAVEWFRDACYDSEH